jgi:co-chaperonin GroES (HSP10)
MDINNKYIVVERLQEEAKEGFKTVEVQDSFVYKGKVVKLPAILVFMGEQQVYTGDTVLFAKYSPDTHEIDFEGKKVKFVNVNDVLAVL